MPALQPTPEKNIIYRGQNVDQQVTFIDNGERIIPVDPSQYPTFLVLDAKNQLIASGVGVEMGDGQWLAHWNVPNDAEPGNWLTKWNMVSNKQKQYETKQTYTVREVNDIELIDDPGIFIFFPNMSDRVTLLLDQPVENIILSVRNFTNDNSEVVHVTKDQMQSEPIGTRTLWYVDLPGFGIGTFMLLWSYFTHNRGPRDKTIKRLEIPPMLYWNLYPKLIDLVDRIQKDSKTPFGYYEEDMLQYMQMGLMEFNRYHPQTSFSLQNFPVGIGFESFLIECSALWAFRSRQLGAGEVMLNYSGQEATLDADRQQPYADQINHIMDNLNTHLVRAKINFIRHTYAPARLGLRLGLGASSTFGDSSLLGGVTSPYLRGFSRSKRRGGW